MTLTPEQQCEIDAQRDNWTATRRACAAGLEAHMFTAHPVLDHGFIRVIDYMGDDAAIVQAARVSYGAGTKSVSSDQGLINYLMRHWHTTPFEMCEIKLHVKLPIFVARQWIRHRTASVNEYSARYSILDREFYLPDLQHMAVQSTTNAQGRGKVLPEDVAQDVQDDMLYANTVPFDMYHLLVSGQTYGLARELARTVLPVSTYTQWYWKVDLHNLLHFLRLRADEHAQYEIRAYADAICKIVADWVPMTWAAFEEYRLGGAQFSRKGVDCLRRMLSGEAVNQETSDMSAGEWREFCAALGRETE